MDTESEKNEKTAVFNLDGATCPSCVFAIEHLGRKIEGIRELKVNTPEHTIEVIYDGDSSRLDRIKHIVHQLGYNATLT